MRLSWDMNRAVFLDRDGTINVDVGYLSDPSELVFIKGSKEGVKLLKDNGFFVFIVTNQSGVGRKYFSLKKLEAIHERLLSEFARDGINIDGIHFCPHHPDEKCRCRKPQPKMVLDIAKKMDIDLGKSYFVGDKLIDVHTGKNAGCKTILIDAGINLHIEDEEDWIQPDFICKDLLSAAKWIIKDSRKRRDYTIIHNSYMKKSI